MPALCWRLDAINLQLHVKKGHPKMIISLVNQKGGVGKTTIAINLAAGLTRKKQSVLLIDADPQANAVQWHAVENNQAFDIIELPDYINKAAVHLLADHHDCLIIDSPPGQSETTRNILEISDLTIIPVSPSPLDIWSCKGTLAMVEEGRRYNHELVASLLITKKILGTRMARDIRDALAGFEVPVMSAELCQRIAYVEAMKNGVSVTQYAPSCKAAKEIAELCDELIKKYVPAETMQTAEFSFEAPDEEESEMMQMFEENL
jgi:chromosome partitioning protein